MCKSTAALSGSFVSILVGLGCDTNCGKVKIGTVEVRVVGWCAGCLLPIDAKDCVKYHQIFAPVPAGIAEAFAVFLVETGRLLQFACCSVMLLLQQARWP